MYVSVMLFNLRETFPTAFWFEGRGSQLSSCTTYNSMPCQNKLININSLQHFFRSATEYTTCSKWLARFAPKIGGSRQLFPYKVSPVDLSMIDWLIFV